MNIQIKPGFTFYSINFDKIVKYEYLTEIPFNSNEMKGKYHVLIDRRLQEPVKVYIDQLEKMVKQSVRTYEEAQGVVVKNLQNRIDSITQSLK